MTESSRNAPVAQVLFVPEGDPARRPRRRSEGVIVGSVLLYARGACVDACVTRFGVVDVEGCRAVPVSTMATMTAMVATAFDPAVHFRSSFHEPRRLRKNHQPCRRRYHDGDHKHCADLHDAPLCSLAPAARTRATSHRGFILRSAPNARLSGSSLFQ